MKLHDYLSAWIKMGFGEGGKFLLFVNMYL